MKKLPKLLATLIVPSIAIAWLVAVRSDAGRNYYGPTGPELVEFLRKVPDNAKVRLTSWGGRADYALSAASIIEEKNLKVLIDAFCLSSCADILLVAATKVYFEDDPLVGLHGNPARTQHFLTEAFPVVPSHCSDAVYQKFKNLYERKNANLEFWQVMDRAMDRTEQLEFKLGSDGCPTVNVRYSEGFWVPTARELRNGLGISVEGNTCADSGNCEIRLRNLGYSPNEWSFEN